MAGPYTREAWNQIIDRVNDLCENPPEDTDCEPIDTLEHVDPEHIWTTGDIDEVRQKLMEICKDNNFEEELDLWKQKIIDEIEEAISQGWCDCEKDECGPASVEETIIYQGTDRYVYPVVPHHCGEWPSPCPGWGRDHFDYYTPATEVVAPWDEGIGGTIQVKRRITRPNGSLVSDDLCYVNHFVCNGSQRTPLPAPRYDEEGDLQNSAKDTEIVTCLACTVYVGGSFVGYCSCQKCWSLPRCCATAPTPPVIWPCWTPPECPCTLDEGYVRGVYGNPQESNGNTYTFVVRKLPIGFAVPLPCRKCCSDGIGWCDQDDCPGDPICGEEEEEEV